MSGVEIVIPLVFWERVGSEGDHLVPLNYGEYNTWTCKGGTVLYAGEPGGYLLVSIDDIPTGTGFVPLSADGHPPGLEEDDDWPAYSNWVFAWRQSGDPRVLWDLSHFGIFPDKGFGHAVPDPPSIATAVRLRRYYRADELLRFRAMGVQPPDDGAEINLQ